MNPTAIFVNVATTILGLLTAFGVNLHIDAATLTQLAGGVAAAVAVANQVWAYLHHQQAEGLKVAHAAHVERLEHKIGEVASKTRAKERKRASGFASLPMLILLVAGSLLLAACAGITPNGNMSPEQLAAAAKDKSASVACGTGTGPWGKVNTVYVNVDKASVTNGTVTVDAECKVSVSTAQKPAAQ